MIHDSKPVSNHFQVFVIFTSLGPNHIFELKYFIILKNSAQISHRCNAQRLIQCDQMPSFFSIFGHLQQLKFASSVKNAKVG